MDDRTTTNITKAVLMVYCTITWSKWFNISYSTFFATLFAGYFATLFFLVSGCFIVFQGFQGVAEIREEKKYRKIVSALKNKDIWGDILGGIVMLLMAILFIRSSGNAAGDLVLPILTIFSPLEVFVVVWVVWLALRHFRAQKDSR